jgi:filamentous hemagglutinin family protein
MNSGEGKAMRQDFGYLKVRRLVVLFGGMLATTPALAQQVVPSGLQVVAGQASLHQNGGQLTVTNSNNAILNWNSFSIGAANSVRFAQPGSSSQVLNRVVGNDPSSILGSLSSNGRVWLLNPNGVLFGANSRVDVAGLVTSTLNLPNSDWLAGRYLFTGGTTAAAIDNQGQLRTTLGGQVALIGGSVSNEGIIEASGGQITLAAGQSVELVDTGAPNLAVKVTAPGGSALNLGSLSAGRIDVMAAAVNQQGLVQAETLSAGPAGEIVLQAGNRLTLAGGSVTRADGSVGGAIKLLGSEIDVQNGSVVSASGAGGGGSILVGGGAEGKDTSVPNAQAVYVAPQASLSADALSQGDGGHIVVWSDVATRAFGRYSAHAGTEGGNGGLIETSGHWLDARPAALDVSAPKGSAGTWLLDPFNITISDSVSDSGTNAAFTATADDATIHTDTIVNALNAGTNVTISTGNGGSQAGTI